MTSTRHGITFGGLIWAAGAGVYLGALPIGYTAMIATAIHDPAMLQALPGALILGALAGLVVAYLTRHQIQPRLERRYGKAALAGATTMPGYIYLGQFHNITDNPAAAQWAIGFILCAGAAALVVYYRWRKRLTLQRYARRAATQAEFQRS
jgi:uncharacterized protein (DUF2062 family)